MVCSVNLTCVYMIPNTLKKFKISTDNILFRSKWYDGAHILLLNYSCWTNVQKMILNIKSVYLHNMSTVPILCITTSWITLLFQLKNIYNIIIESYNIKRRMFVVPFMIFYIQRVKTVYVYCVPKYEYK